MAKIHYNDDAELITFDMAVSDRHVVTISGNRRLAVTNVSIGKPFFIRIVQDATGGRSVTWFSGIRWTHGTIPSLTTEPDKADTFQFMCISESNYDGFVIGQNL